MSRLRHGEGSIETRTRGDGSTAYRARWVDEQGKHGKTFNDLESARAHLETVGRKRRQGRYVSPSALLVTEMVDAYLERCRDTLSSSTLATYRQRAERYIAPTIGQRRVVSLTTPDVQRWIDRLARELAPSSVRVVAAILSGACADAVRLGIIDHNPAHGIRFPKKRRPATDIWDVRDIQRVLDTVRPEPFWYALYLLAITSGMRPGEIRGLQWDCVDVAGQCVVVRRTMTRDEDDRPTLGEETKGKRDRVVALTAATIAALDALPRRGPFVFAGGQASYLPATTWDRYHRRLCARSGVKRIRLHDLRHSSASLELMSGAHPKVVSDRLGHTSTLMTIDRYTHLVPAIQRSAADRLGEMLGETHGETPTPNQPE